MKIIAIAAACFCPFAALALDAPAPVTVTQSAAGTVASAVTQTAPSAPGALTAGTEVLTAPAEAAGLTPGAEVELAEPVIEDDAEKITVTALDYSKAETRLLAKISESISPEMQSLLFNLEENGPAEKPGIGVNEVKVADLYKELARRAVAEDKEARQALTLADVKGDTRAKEARLQAFEERLANSLIKRFENGDKGAKDELMKQALKGNLKAREYLKLDAAAPVAVPEALSGAAKTLAPATVPAAAQAVSSAARPRTSTAK